jgi:hypothetical protein
MAISKITRAQNRNFALAAGFHRMAQPIEHLVSLPALFGAAYTERTHFRLPSGRKHAGCPIETNPFPSAVSHPAADSVSVELGLVRNDRGGKLAARLKRCRPLSQQTLECAAYLADELDSAHGNNTIRYSARGPDSRELATHPLRSGLGWNQSASFPCLDDSTNHENGAAAWRAVRFCEPCCGTEIVLRLERLLRQSAR